MKLRLATVYGIAGAAAAGVWTWLYFLSPGLAFPPLRAFATWYVFCWPAPLTCVMLLPASRLRFARITSIYVLAGMAAVALWTVAGRAVSGHTDVSVMGNLRGFITRLVLEAGPPAVFIAILAYHRIRGVSPLLLAGLLVFTFSSFAATQAFITLVDVGGLRAPLLKIGLRGWFLLATVPVGYLCWRLLVLLNAAYLRRLFGDVQLFVDSIWVIVAFLFSVSYAADFGWRGMFGLAGLVVYRLVAQLGVAHWRPPPAHGTRLLMLRVFGFRGRTEKLFDSIAQRWRFRGEVAMIAGPDLAARTIDPDDTLAFAAGELPSRFVAGVGDLRERLSSMDERRDPDGRFRAAEFFCHANTWSYSLTALLGRCDVILMDLRGFSESHSGRLFELRQLAAQGRLPDTVFLVDATTDLTLLGSAVRTVEPNAAAAVELRLERAESDSAFARERVYRSLCLAGIA